jgi:hypothetical protein
LLEDSSLSPPYRIENRCASSALRYRHKHHNTPGNDRLTLPPLSWEHVLPYTPPGAVVAAASEDFCLLLRTVSSKGGWRECSLRAIDPSINAELWIGARKLHVAVQQCGCTRVLVVSEAPPLPSTPSGGIRHRLMPSRVQASLTLPRCPYATPHTLPMCHRIPFFWGAAPSRALRDWTDAARAGGGREAATGAPARGAPRRPPPHRHRRRRCHLQAPANHFARSVR